MDDLDLGVGLEQGRGPLHAQPDRFDDAGLGLGTTPGQQGEAIDQPEEPRLALRAFAESLARPAGLRCHGKHQRLDVHGLESTAQRGVEDVRHQQGHLLLTLGVELPVEELKKTKTKTIRDR